MAEINDVADPRFVAEQYRDAANLNARIALHRRFSTNKYGWQRWIMDQLHFPAEAEVLELGCGTGSLWQENAGRLPPVWQVTLSDLSASMVRQARQNVGAIPRKLHFATLDARSIPFESGSMDGIVANHMLYHVPYVPAALSEIRRVLKPGGRFYASTIGERHLGEIRDLIARFDARLTMWGHCPFGSFTLESGADQLQDWFRDVTLTRYEDDLIVTEPGALIDYVLSGKMVLSPDQRAAFALFVHEEFQTRGNKFYITKDSGMFECRLGDA